MTTKLAMILPEGHAVTPDTMLDVAVTAMLTAAGEVSRWPRVIFEEELAEDKPWGTRHYLSTRCDQGLPSWTFVYYNRAGRYADTDITFAQDWPAIFGDDPEDGDELATPACTFKVVFDGSHEQSEMHAQTIHLIQRWARERGGSVKWSMPPEARWHAADDRQAWLQLAREHCWRTSQPQWMTGLPELDIRDRGDAQCSRNAV